MRSRFFKIICCFAVVFALCLTALPACSSDDVSPACAAYIAGKSGVLSAAHRADDELILPAEFVRAFALYAGGAEKETCLRLCYDDDPRWIKDYLDAICKSPEELLELMNKTAWEIAPGLQFGSVCGLRDKEEELYRLFDRAVPEFAESRGKLTAMLQAAEAFSQCEALVSALSGSVATFADGSKKTRTAPLVSENSQFHLDEARWYLAGSAVMDGRQVYAALGEAEDGAERAWAAVIADSGEDSPVNYAACDVGNLCGQALGQHYGLHYSASHSVDSAGMTVGSSIFSGAILVILIAAGVMLIFAIVAGVIMTVRRNRAGRRKYAPKPAAEPEAEERNEEQKK